MPALAEMRPAAPVEAATLEVAVEDAREALPDALEAAVESLEEVKVVPFAEAE